MAKQKDDEIYIGEGKNLHISENKIQNAARITRTREGYNIVNINDQEFKIKYIQFGNKYSISLSFMYDDKQLSWRPKQQKDWKALKVDLIMFGSQGILLIIQQLLLEKWQRKYSKQNEIL